MILFSPYHPSSFQLEHMLLLQLSLPLSSNSNLNPPSTPLFTEVLLLLATNCPSHQPSVYYSGNPTRTPIILTKRLSFLVSCCGEKNSRNANFIAFFPTLILKSSLRFTHKLVRKSLISLKFDLIFVSHGFRSCFVRTSRLPE